MSTTPTLDIWRSTLAKALNEALNDEPPDGAHLSQWYERHAEDIVEVLGQCPGIDLDLEIVYHWLSDADIRVRDPAYAQAQLDEMRAIAGKLST